jgi:hypothetical protein
MSAVDVSGWKMKRVHHAVVVASTALSALEQMKPSVAEILRGMPAVDVRIWRMSPVVTAAYVGLTNISVQDLTWSSVVAIQLQMIVVVVIRFPSSLVRAVVTAI